MKKYFMMALLAALVMLSGCKKEAFQTSDNFFAKHLKMAEGIIGGDRTNAENILKDDGWTYSSRYSDISEGGLAYTTNGSMTVVYVHYELLSHENMQLGNAYAVDFYFSKGYATELTDEQVFREFINLLGATPKISGEKFTFEEYYYSKGDGEDYDEFVSKFTNIFKSKEWAATWWADGESQDARYFNFGQTDGMTTLSLVLGDE